MKSRFYENLFILQINAVHTHFRQRLHVYIKSIIESSHQGNRLPPNEEVPEIPTIYEPYSGVEFNKTNMEENKGDQGKSSPSFIYLNCNLLKVL